MDEEGLKFAFGKVEKDEDEHEMLVKCGRHGGDGQGKVRVEISTECGPKKERVDQERPHIFDNEDCTPANLEA